MSFRTVTVVTILAALLFAAVGCRTNASSRNAQEKPEVADELKQKLQNWLEKNAAPLPGPREQPEEKRSFSSDSELAGQDVLYRVN